MRGATAPRLLLELLCARMLLPSVSDDESALLQRLERLERRSTVAADGQSPAAPPPERSFQRPSQRAAAGAGAPSAEPQRPAAPQSRPPQPPAAHTAVPASRPATPEPAAPQPAPQPVPQPTAQPAPQAAPPAADTIDAAALRRIWPDLLAATRKISRSTEAMLMNATVQSVDGSTVVLAHTAEALARRLSEPRNADSIAAALHDVLGGTWQVRCVHGGGGGGAGRPGNPGPRPQPNPPQRAAAPERSYQRPAPAQPAPVREQAPEPDIPLPPEPEDEESLLAEEPIPVGADLPRAEALDPEAMAHKLLAEHLGARPLD
jgi:DNA polymerase-3 subunit gamma/tau